MFQGLVWFWLTQTDTKLGNSLSQASTAILAGELIPGVDLPKGAVLGALIDKGQMGLGAVGESVKNKMVDAVDGVSKSVTGNILGSDGTNLTDTWGVITGGYKDYIDNPMTRAECRKKHTEKPGLNWRINEEGTNPPYIMNVTTAQSPYGAGHPRYTTFVDDEIFLDNYIPMPPSCVLRDNEDGSVSLLGHCTD